MNKTCPAPSSLGARLSNKHPAPAEICCSSRPIISREQQIKLEAALTSVSPLSSSPNTSSQSWSALYSLSFSASKPPKLKTVRRRSLKLKASACITTAKQWSIARRKPSVGQPEESSCEEETSCSSSESPGLTCLSTTGLDWQTCWLREKEAEMDGNGLMGQLPMPQILNGEIASPTTGGAMKTASLNAFERAHCAIINAIIARCLQCVSRGRSRPQTREQANTKCVPFLLECPLPNTLTSEVAGSWWRASSQSSDARFFASRSLAMGAYHSTLIKRGKNAAFISTPTLTLTWAMLKDGESSWWSKIDEQNVRLNAEQKIVWWQN